MHEDLKNMLRRQDGGNARGCKLNRIVSAYANHQRLTTEQSMWLVENCPKASFRLVGLSERSPGLDVHAESDVERFRREYVPQEATEELGHDLLLVYSFEEHRNVFYFCLYRSNRYGYSLLRCSACGQFYFTPESKPLEYCSNSCRSKLSNPETRAGYLSFSAARSRFPDASSAVAYGFGSEYSRLEKTLNVPVEDLRIVMDVIEAFSHQIEHQGFGQRIMHRLGKTLATEFHAQNKSTSSELIRLAANCLDMLQPHAGRPYPMIQPRIEDPFAASRKSGAKRPKDEGTNKRTAKTKAKSKKRTKKK